MTLSTTTNANTNAKRLLATFAAALLFASGLVVSGMSTPAKVIAFLDVTGAWDPSLMFVMVGAIGVHAVFLRLTRRLAAPLFDDAFHASGLRSIDASLVGGAALFGIGWGLSGICPGPGFVTMMSGALPVIVFMAAMLAGFGLHALWQRRSRIATTTTP